MVINIYIDTEPDRKNQFDHPTSWKNFDRDNTFAATVDSLDRLKIPGDSRLSLYIPAIAAHNDRRYDRQNKEKINGVISRLPQFIPIHIFTNTDIAGFRRRTGEKFFSTSGYPEIRNLGLILPVFNNEDVIIQIDDDELLRPNYLLRLQQILQAHPDKSLFTAPYEKEGTVRIKSEDPLACWPKYSTMDADMEKLMKEPGPVETLFGFGGNIIIRQRLARKSLYPPGVPRGEDFSYLLANRLIFENGAPGIPVGDPDYLAYFLPDRELTIIHRPPAEARADFLSYLELNLKRFIMENNIFKNQSGLSGESLRSLSYYLSAMIDRDMNQQLEEILQEIEGDYPSPRLERFAAGIKQFLKEYQGIDRLAKHRQQLKEYRAMIERFA
ncbi:MAG: hypothetical protein ACOCZ3_02045 [Bacillota bacterium]